MFATVIHSEAFSKESSFSTDIWEFENQLSASHIGSHDIWTIMYGLYMMTHGDIKLDLDDEDDEIRRAQNEINIERVEECAFPSI